MVLGEDGICKHQRCAAYLCVFTNIPHAKNIFFSGGKLVSVGAVWTNGGHGFDENGSEVVSDFKNL